jgi:hypothetical protein
MLAEISFLRARRGIEFLLEFYTLSVKAEDFVEIHSFHDFIVESFSDKVRIGAKDFDIDHNLFHKKYLLGERRRVLLMLLAPWGKRI